MKKEDYQRVAVLVRAELPDTPTSRKTVRYITAEACEQYRNAVIRGRPFPDAMDRSNSGGSARCHIILFGLPLMCTDEELESGFYAMLMARGEEMVKKVLPYSFRQITGVYGCSTHHRKELHVYAVFKQAHIRYRSYFGWSSYPYHGKIQLTDGLRAAILQQFQEGKPIADVWEHSQMSANTAKLYVIGAALCDVPDAEISSYCSALAEAYTKQHEEEIWSILYEGIGLYIAGIRAKPSDLRDLKTSKSVEVRRLATLLDAVQTKWMKTNTVQPYKTMIAPHDLEALPDWDESKVREKIRTCIEGNMKSRRICPTIRSIINELCRDQELHSMLQLASGYRTVKQLRDLVAEELIRKKQELMQENEEELQSSEPSLVLYFAKDVGGCNLGYATVSFEPIAGTSFEEEIRRYSAEYLSGVYDKELKKRCDSCFRLIKFAKYEISHGFAIQSGDVRRQDVLLFMHELQQHGSKGSTLKLYFMTLTVYFRTVMIRNIIDEPPDYDPTAGIYCRDGKWKVPEEKRIPDDILMLLDERITECADDIQLIYHILRATGWRFNEVVRLTTDDIQPIEDGTKYAGVSTERTKTRRACRKRGLDPRLKDVIPITLYNDLVSYIEKTAIYRKRYGTNLIFFTIKSGMVKKIGNGLFNKSVNEILPHHPAINVAYSRFSASQIRTTTASILIDGGVELPDVQRKLGHLSPETTVQYYIAESKRKLQEKDSELFREQFENLLGNNRQFYTAEQRQLLFEDELGTSMGHPYGSCSKMGCGKDPFACLTCSSLVLSEKDEPWFEEEEFRTKNMLAKLREFYRSKNIDEKGYDKFEEYHILVRELEAIEKALEAIRKAS